MEILSGAPILKNWLIRYDSWGMPQFIQGYLIGDLNETQTHGSAITINDIEYMDVAGSFIRTSKGQTINLLGHGKRIVFQPDDIFYSVKPNNIGDMN